MNTVQRKFLVDKIEQKTREKISDLENQRKKYPSASNYIFRAVLNDTIEIADKKTIIEALKERALLAKEGENWLQDDNYGMNSRRWGEEKERDIKLRITDLIIVPADYKKERDRVEKYNELIEKQVEALKAQLETLIIRIQISSDKNLQKMVNEVDDMGDLSLMDTKVKLLN